MKSVVTLGDKVVDERIVTHKYSEDMDSNRAADPSRLTNYAESLMMDLWPNAVYGKYVFSYVDGPDSVTHYFRKELLEEPAETLEA